MLEQRKKDNAIKEINSLESEAWRMLEQQELEDKRKIEQLYLQELPSDDVVLMIDQISRKL